MNEIKTIKATRNGKPIQIDVRFEYNDPSNPNATIWVRKADGKPLYGTTGYFRIGDSNIVSYRQKIILENVEIL